MSGAARFQIGKMVATRRAADALAEANIAGFALVERHAGGDWGDVSEEAREENERAIAQQRRITSTYTLSTGVKVWVMTEADRSETAIMLPEEYEE